MSDKEKSEPCNLCGSHWWPNIAITVSDHNAPPNKDGIVLLVAHYKDAYLCEQCLSSVGYVLEQRRRKAFKHWIYWDEEDCHGKLRTFAYHKERNFTWELLDTGRPKKLSEVVFPPWMRHK
jgi:hypothetical protein